MALAVEQKGESRVSCGVSGGRERGGEEGGHQGFLERVVMVVAAMCHPTIHAAGAGGVVKGKMRV